MKRIKIIIMLFLANIINISSTGLTKNSKTKTGINKLIFTNNFPEKEIFNKQLLNIILKQAFQGKPIQKHYNCPECPSIFPSKLDLNIHKASHFTEQQDNKHHNQFNHSYDLDINQDNDSSSDFDINQENDTYTDSDFDDQILIDQYIEEDLVVDSSLPKSYKCNHPGCNYITVYNSNLKRHQKIHKR